MLIATLPLCRLVYLCAQFETSVDGLHMPTHILPFIGDPAKHALHGKRGTVERGAWMELGLGRWSMEGVLTPQSSPR